MSRNIDFAQTLENNLSPDLWHLIELSGELGAVQGQPLYLVGGTVRDLLLEIVDGDLDLVVEGDALALAQTLADQHGGEVTSHPRFGTAKYRRGDLTIDLATARSEAYSKPGALPVVRPGTIDADLSRRDFTINSMAIHLSPPHLGTLLDPFDGQGDLAGRLIRVLHPKSFIDDATRIMRAIRYEQRLGFHLEQGTEELLLRDLSYLESVGVDRLRHELELVLQEERPELALGRADQLGVLAQGYPPLRADEWLANAFQRVRPSGPVNNPDAYFALLFYGMSGHDADNFVQRYRFTKEQVKIVRDLMTLRSQRSSLEASGLRPSETYELLKGLDPVALQAYEFTGEPALARERVQHYLEELRYVKPCLDGHQLKALGVPGGPAMGRLLKRLLNARLDGEVESREDELSLVERWLKKEGGR